MDTSRSTLQLYEREVHFPNSQEEDRGAQAEGSVYPDRVRTMMDAYAQLKGRGWSPTGMAAEAVPLAPPVAPEAPRPHSDARESIEAVPRRSGTTMHTLRRPQPSVLLRDTERAPVSPKLESDLLAVVLSLLLHDKKAAPQGGDRATGGPRTRRVWAPAAVDMHPNNAPGPPAPGGTVYPTSGALQAAVLERLEAAVVRPYHMAAAGVPCSPTAVGAPAAAAAAAVADALHAVLACVHRQGTAALQTAVYLLRFEGRRGQAALAQAVMQCLPVEPTSGPSGAPAGPGGWVAPVYRVESWLTTAHLVEVALALAEALRRLLLLQCRVPAAMDAPAAPPPPPLFRMVALPSSAAPGAGPPLPPPYPDAVDGLAELRRVVGRRCGGGPGADGRPESLQVVEAALQATLREVFEDPAVLLTVVEEVAKKLSPPPPPDRRRVNT